MRVAWALWIWSYLSGCSFLNPDLRYKAPYVNSDVFLHSEHDDAHHFYRVRPVIRLAPLDQMAEPWEQPRELLEVVAEITIESSEETRPNSFLVRDSEHFEELSDVARRLGGEYFMIAASHGDTLHGWVIDALALRRPIAPQRRSPSNSIPK